MKAKPDQQPAARPEEELLEILVSEVRAVYRETYIRAALHLPRLDNVQRPEPEVDVDYDPRGDKLYIWYDDPVILTPGGASYAGAFLTGYPDIIPNVSRLKTPTLLAFIRLRAEHHAALDARVNGIRSTTKLKACYAATIVYLHGEEPAPPAADPAADDDDGAPPSL